MSSRRVEPSGRRVRAAFRAIPSKSVTHRALVTAALAAGDSRVRSPLDSDDTRRTREGLSVLGIPVLDRGDHWIVKGASGKVPGGGSLELGESGTSYRFLTAVASLGERPSRLDGGRRLRERPVTELLECLRALGAGLEAEGPGAGLPLRAGGAPVQGGEVDVESGRSSQFASALLLIGPSLPEGLTLRLIPPVVSHPYVELTARVLESFGASVVRGGARCYRVRPGGLRGRDYRVEGDHSSSSYLLAAAAICGGTIRMDGLHPGSAQADARFLGMLETLGCSVRAEEEAVEVEGSGVIPGFDLDAGGCPDLVPTLAALAVHATGRCRIHGVPHLRWKESDRLEVLAENLNGLGRTAWTEAGALHVDPPVGPLRPAAIRTASDHRIAMAFAVAGLRVEVQLDDADCVAKSYPSFWSDFSRLKT